MASIYDLKPAFQGILRPISDWLAKHGVTANQVTISALLLSIATGGAIALFPDQPWALLLIAPVLFLRMALNAIDGMLAREHDMKSDLGAFLNELGDVLSDAALYLPLALVPGIPSTLIVLIVLTSIIVEMTGVIAVMVGSDRRYDGPMGKSDRAVGFGAVTLLMGLGMSADIWSTTLLSVILALSVITIFRRAHAAITAH